MHAIDILTSVNTIIKQKTKISCIYNKHAQNYTKYARNGAFTNGTPKKVFKLLIYT